jgi:hypothetical protein
VIIMNIDTPNRRRRRAIANGARTAREDIAIEIAKRVSETGARTEDWLNEGFVYRIVREKAEEVLRERA